MLVHNIGHIIMQKKQMYGNMTQGCIKDVLDVTLDIYVIQKKFGCDTGLMERKIFRLCVFFSRIKSAWIFVTESIFL